jgi:hypothetical protein
MPIFSLTEMAEVQMSGKDKGEGEPQRDNPRRWTKAPPLPGIPADARWDLLDARSNFRVTQDTVVPIFIELLPETAADIDALIEFFRKAVDQYTVPGDVMDRLRSEQAAQRDDGPILLTLLSRPDSVESRFWKVVSVGQPQAHSFRRDGFYCGRSLGKKTGRLSKTPVVAIIDDSIGFLHRRFRRSDNTTRFHRLWIMHTDILAGDPGDHDMDPDLGIKLDASRINTRLASNRSEEALYRQVNNGVFGPANRHGTAFHAGHGTHVLDIATGAAFHEPMAAVPIIGVQLSPAAIGETSGALLDPELKRGLQWVVETALQMKGRFPLVINISLGSLAGPLDGTSSVERCIAAEIRRYHHFSGGAPIRVVIAYGNAHKARLVAEVTLAKGDETTLDWHILPDDATKSVLELRTDTGQGAQLSLDLTPPDSGPALALGQWPNGIAIQQYSTPSGVAAEVASEPEPANAPPLRDKLLVTIAPTTRSDPRPFACSGIWQVKVGNTGVDPITVSFKVQRDDTPGGYRRHGRQSWLDHPSAWGWEPELRAYALPDATSPISRKNTEVGYAGREGKSTYFVGAARPDTTGASGFRPSRYSAEGGLPLPDYPTLSAIGDDGSALTGVRAAGVISGATARLSGTSMAAPSVTRRLLEYAMNGSMTLLRTQPEMTFVLGQAPSAAADPRLGFGTVPA